MPLDLNMVDNFHFAPPPKASAPPLTDCNRGVDTQGACQEERWGHRALVSCRGITHPAGGSGLGSVGHVEGATYDMTLLSTLPSGV